MRTPSILCGVDFSKASARALRAAAALARERRRRLVVVFVEDPVLDAAARAAGDRRTSPSSTTPALERFVARALKGTPRVRMETAVSVGDPAEEILKAARRHVSNLVVLGTRGMGRAAQVLLGSTAAAVLRSTRVPVLAVPS